MPASVLSDASRLAVLRDLGILDTPPEPNYDDIARLAATCCDSDIAAVNFVDDERHWTKAIVGVDGGQGSTVPADVSFCAATVATDDGLLSIENTMAADAWRSHPLVTGGPAVRFYAGAAIVVSGHPIGVVCVFGDEPRALDDENEQALIALARQASAQLELRKRNEELRRFAVTDPLTGLNNRTLLFDHLTMAINQRARSGDDVGVLFCDADGFKGVNDRWGHDAGDRLLCQIARRLRQATRIVDTVARFAGDEFVVLCPGLRSADELEAIVERIERRIGTPQADDGPVTPKLSIGAILVEDGDDAASALRRADEAMYVAKARRPARGPR